MNYPKLFSPITIRGLTLKNRVVMSAMGMLMVGVDKKVNQKLTDYLAARAKGGVGLVYAQCCGIQDSTTPDGFLGIGTDELGESHKMLTEAIHKAGGKAGLQLIQGSINAAPKKILVASEKTGYDGSKIPGMTIEEIKEIIEEYGNAARRAVEAGYDIIELHAAHSYLIHQFLNAGTNKRTDEYGGSFENRARLAMEVIRKIRSVMPEDMPLSMRIGSRDDDFEEGSSIEEMIRFARLAGQEGVDVLSISRGNCEGMSMRINVAPVEIPQGFNLDDARRIHKETGMITAVSGRINHAEMAEKILEDDDADLVVMARAQLADAEFCNKSMEGRDDEVIHCIGCNQGCFDPNLVMEYRYNDVHCTCLRNPAVGREKEFEFVKTKNPKKVMVIGGGMGGMEAAYRLKMLGHEPVVYEASDHLGGQFVLAGATPHKEEFQDAVKECADRLKRLKVEVKLNSKADAAAIESEKPDEVIIAIGSAPIMLKLDGMDKKPTYNSHDVLAGKAKPEGRVAVIGGGMVGLETAELLSSFGNKVSVIEMREDVAIDMGLLRKMCTMENIAKEGIEKYVNARCKAVNNEGVVAETPDGDITVPCDSIVIAVGVKACPSDDLKEACDKNNIPYQVIGDAVKARRALESIAEGAEAAYKIG
jgi:2,4-dienoyl-CoA reductase-like NADH-dependent reductase (Old Yellow Enzyme family)/thioredoxin reductase